MRLTVLGNQGPFPSGGGATSGYLVERSGAVLVDCGSAVLSRLIGIQKLDELKGVILSHLHFDHIADLAVLGYAYQSMAARGLLKEGFTLPVWLPSSPTNIFDIVMSYQSGNVFDFHPIKADDEIEVDGMRVSFCPARHPVECVGMRFSGGGKTLYYTGDTNTLESLAESASKADLLLADGCFVSKVWNEKLPHLSARHCAELARNAGAKRLVITHLPPFAENDAYLDDSVCVFENTELAVIGEKYEI